jgi:hypothetical protein
MNDIDVIFTQPLSSNADLRMVQFNENREIIDIFEGDKKVLLKILAKMLKIEERIEFRRKRK